MDENNDNIPHYHDDDIIFWFENWSQLKWYSFGLTIVLFLVSILLIRLICKKIGFIKDYSINKSVNLISLRIYQIIILQLIV